MQALATMAIEESKLFGSVIRMKMSRNLKRKRFTETLKKSNDENDLEQLNPIDENPEPSDEDTDNEQFDGIDGDGEASNQSSLSSSSVNGSGLRLTKVKHGHKMLITEEKMTDALRNFHLNAATSPPTVLHDNNSNSSSANTLVDESMSMPAANRGGEDDDNSDNDRNDEFWLSDELKSKLKEYNRSAYLLNHNDSISKVANVNNKNSNQMQLVLWSPRVEMPSPKQDEDDENSNSSSVSDDSEMICYNNKSHHRHSSSSTLSNSSSKSSIDSLSQQPQQKQQQTTHSSSPTISSSYEHVHVDEQSPYRVEEPTGSDDLTPTKTTTNKLKRKYSQLNKINIEEVTNEPDSIGNRPQPSFYLVDQSNDFTDLAYISALSGRGSSGRNTTYSRGGGVVIAEITSQDEVVFDENENKIAEQDEIQEMEF